MKKRKTYEVSVINKTHSKTYSDETKFYTSDTALELNFQLKEVEYDFDSAEIILLNVDDRSLVTRPVVKSAEGFTYELEDDIVARFGEWKGQLKFNEGGEIYVSSPVSFRIENDLNNDRPPQLTDIRDWETLRQSAKDLIAEMGEAVTNEAVRVEAEKQREETVANIEARQTSVENQFNAINQELTDKDVISAPEIIAARGGEPTLSARLDKEQREVTAQLAQTEAYPFTSKQIQTTSFSPKPIVVFTFDDAPTEDLTVIKPMFDAFGYKGTIYAIPGFSGTRRVASGYTIDYMTKEQLKSLSDEGWEIGAHTMTHIQMGVASEATIEYEMGESKRVLQDWGFNVTNFAYPFGSTSPLAKRIAAKHFRTATLFGGPKTPVKPPLDKPAVPRKSLGSFFDPVTAEFPVTNTFEGYYKHWVDDAINNSNLTIFALHSFATDAIQLNYLQQTLQYCNDNNVTVMTLDDALNHFDNTLDIKSYNADNSVKANFVIDANGTLQSGNLVSTNLIPASERVNYNQATLPESYPMGNSILVVPNAADLWPVFNGKVIVHTDNSFGAKDLVRQFVFNKWGNGIKYRTAKANGDWNDFIDLTSDLGTKSLNGFKPLSVTGGIDLAPKEKRVFDVPFGDIPDWRYAAVANTNKALPDGIYHKCYNQANQGVKLEIENIGTVVRWVPGNIEFNIRLI